MSHLLGSSSPSSANDGRKFGLAFRQEYQIISDREMAWMADEPAILVLPGSPSKPISRPDWRNHLSDLVQSVAFQTIGGVAILANALIIGFETDCPEFPYWHWVEDGFLLLFSLELGARVLSSGISEFFLFDNEDYAWNIFDVIIVMIGIVDALSSIGKASAKANGSNATLLRMVRLFRIVRIFKIIRFMKQLYLLAFGFVDALRSVFWVTLLMVFVHYVCSIVLVRTVGHLPETEEHHAFMNERYGTILSAMLSLFDLMCQPDMRPYNSMLSSFPFLTFFLISWIIFGSFGMIALLTGVISESMFEKNGLRIDQERLEREEKRHDLNTALNKIFDGMIEESTVGYGHVSTQQVLQVLPEVMKLFDSLSITYTRHDIEHVVKIMDADESGTISREEYLSSFVSVAEEIRPMSIAELFHSVQVVKSKVTKCQKVLENIEDTGNPNGKASGILDAIECQGRKGSENSDSFWRQISNGSKLSVDSVGGQGNRANSNMFEDTGRVDYRLSKLEMTIHELGKKFDRAMQKNSSDCLSNLEVKIDKVAKAQLKGATDSSIVLKAVENLAAGATDSSLVILKAVENLAASLPLGQAQGVPAVNSCDIGLATKLNVCEQGILETKDMVCNLQNQFRKIATNIQKRHDVCRSEVEALCNQVNSKRIWQAAVSEMEARVLLLRSAYNEAEQELHRLQQMIPHEASLANAGTSGVANKVGAEDGTIQRSALVSPSSEVAIAVREDTSTLDTSITPTHGTTSCA